MKKDVYGSWRTIFVVCWMLICYINLVKIYLEEIKQYNNILLIREEILMKGLKGMLVNFLDRIIKVIYYRNPISYKLLKQRYYFGAIICIPAFPVWNYLANKEIKKIHNKGSIYKIPNGKSRFYLPDLCLKQGELIQNRIFLERGYFEQAHLNNIKPYVKTDAVILDIGANIGNHTLYFINECNASKVYAFEPVKSTFKILQKNIRLNKLEKCVCLQNIALGNSEGKARIIYADEAGGNMVEADNSGNVVIKALDNIQILEQIDFIKIDVEGYELNVLMGAKKILKLNHPLIMIEIFDFNFDKVNLFLNSCGYECISKLDRDYIYKYIVIDN